MNTASRITLTLDERGARMIAADKDLSFIDEHLSWGGRLTLKPITIGGKRLAVIGLNDQAPDWWGGEIVKHVPWAIALTYGAGSSATNFLDTVADGEYTTVEFQGPKAFLEAARAIALALAKAQPVQDPTLEQMKARLREFGIFEEESEDAAA